MDFITPLTLFLLFICVGIGLVRMTPLGRRFGDRSAAIWTIAFAIGALGATMGLGAAQLLH